MDALEGDGDPRPLTLASRQALAMEAGLDRVAAGHLEKWPLLEQGFAALVDDGQWDPAYRLVARMLTPAKAILWLILCRDMLEEKAQAHPDNEDHCRSALLGYVKNPCPETKAAAQVACATLDGTHALAIAAGGLSLAGEEVVGQAAPYPSGLFADLVGRSVWLTSLSFVGDSREKCIFGKKLAACGVSLALASDKKVS